MADIQILPLNEVHVKITGEPGVIEEMSDFFTFEVPGCQHTPLYKQRLWDGKIRLFNRRYNTLYRGLLSYVQKFCEERQYTCQIDPTLAMQFPFTHGDAERFIATLNLPKPVRDYQLESFVRSIRLGRVLIISPTASGKSLLLYLLVRYFQHLSLRKVLIIVPTTNLVEQLYTDFQSYGWDAEPHVHRQYEGHSKVTTKFVTISTWQSIFEFPGSYFEPFEAILGDECHQYKAKSLKTIMEALTRTQYRIGCTGTLDGTKTHAMVLEGLFGPLFKATSTIELMEAKHIATISIKCLVLKYPVELAKASTKLDYAEEIRTILDHPQRMKFVTNLALSLQGNTLILFQFVARHGDILFTSLRAAAETGRKVFFIFGDTPAEEREATRRIVEKENNAIIVASYGTFSTGINIQRLHNVIFSSPSKSVIRVLQSVGRGLRRAEDKETMTLYDIVDDLRHGRHTNFALKHFMKRVDIYNAEQFPFKLYPIDLP